MAGTGPLMPACPEAGAPRDMYRHGAGCAFLSAAGPFVKSFKWPMETLKYETLYANLLLDGIFVSMGP